MTGFCHLNLHTDRSQYVGMIRVPALVDRAKRIGLSAVAISDHDNLCAAVQLYIECKRYNLKPIYGMEASVCDDKTQRKRGTKNLVLLAKNLVGFKNLVTLSTIGSMYFYYRPRIDLSDLRKYGEGLIALTACLNGLTSGAFFQGGQDGLDAQVQELKQIFHDDLYLEIEPTIKDTQRVYNDACRLNHEAHGTPLIVTGDPHYLDASDAYFHENFMRIKALSSKDGGWQYPFTGQYHLRNYDEMVEQFSDLHGYDITMLPVFKRAFDNVSAVVDSIDRFDIKEGVKIPTHIV